MDSLNWGQKMVHANSEEVESKQKIKVAMIDSGINYDLDIFENRIINTKYNYSSSGGLR